MLVFPVYLYITIVIIGWSRLEYIGVFGVELHQPTIKKYTNHRKKVGVTVGAAKSQTCNFYCKGFLTL